MANFIVTLMRIKDIFDERKGILQKKEAILTNKPTSYQLKKMLSYLRIMSLSIILVSIISLQAALAFYLTFINYVERNNLPKLD
jgi:hypothetical protein